MQYAAMTTISYMDRLLALHGSMEEHCQPYHLYVLAHDDLAVMTLDKLQLPNVTVVSWGVLMNSALLDAKDRQYPHQFIWTTKAAFLLHLLEDGLDRVAYIDTDSFFFGSPKPVFDEIGRKSVGITKHWFSPAYHHCHCNGLYNGGFVYIRRNKYVMEKLLPDWLDSCILGNEGPITDQLVMSRWPVMHGRGKIRVHTIEHRGMNVAPWNQGTYTMNVRNGQLYASNWPVIWYHFHGGVDDTKFLEPIAPVLVFHGYEPYRAALMEAGTKLAVL